MKKTVFSTVLALILSFTVCLFAACNGTPTTVPDPEEGKIYTVVVEGGKGSGVYPSGAPCTAIADIPDGYVFQGWYSGDELVSEQTPYKFKVEKDVTLQAVVHQEYVTVTVSGGATINSLIGSQRVKVGEEVTVSAESNQNRQFAHFMLNGNPTQTVTENPYTFTATEDIFIQAVYGDKVCLISVVNGRVSNSASNKFNVGDECTVIADEESAGMVFMCWYIIDSLGNQVSVSIDKEYTFEVTDTIVIYAKYAYKLSLTVTNGKIADSQESSGYYFEYEKVKLVADENTAGHYFSHWVHEGKFLSKDREIEFEMGVTSTTVEAVFVDQMLATPSSDEIYHWFGAGNEFLRYKPQETADIFNTPGIDYIIWYVYASPDAEKDDYIGMFKFYSQINGGTDIITTMDGSIVATYLGGNNNDRCNWGGAGLEETDAIIAACIGEGYDADAPYYFAIQLVSKYDSGYANSEISAIDPDSYRGK